MATVQRKYVLSGPDTTELPKIVPGATVINGSKAWAEIEYDDATSGITDALDEFMAQFGYAFNADAGKSGIRVRSPDGTSKDIKADDVGNVFVGGFSPPTAGNYACPTTVAVGEAVYLSAADTVDKADATDNTKIAIGVVTSKPTTTSAVVALFGEAPVFSGLTPGATYYLATTPGAVTAVPPSASGNVVQPVGFARNATTLVIQVDRNYTVLA